MMQISESYNQRHSLFNAMSRFIGAVNNMDQTVMVPSLLRDVPLDDETLVQSTRTNGSKGTSSSTTTTNAYFHDAGGDVVYRTASNNGTTTTTNGYFQDADAGDMYSYYVLLKSIRNDIEWGILQGDERRKEKIGVTALDISTMESDDEGLEKQFHYHLNGLHTVLSKLTRKANTLTSRYKQEIGIRGCGH